jgi:hypothetical protein
MSTGLTYVTIADDNLSGSPSITGTYVFSSYDEAYNFGGWFVTLYDNLSFTVLIWTSSPNNNGYWNKAGGVATFTIFD